MIASLLLADATTDTGSHSAAPGLGGMAFFVSCGVAGYLRANQISDRTGRGPWGRSPLFWALVCFLLSLIGLILVFVASWRTPKNVAASAVLGDDPPAPFAPPNQPMPPMTIEQAWAAPGANPPAVALAAPAFPAPAVPAQGTFPAPAVPASGVRTAPDVLPSGKAKRRFR